MNAGRQFLSSVTYQPVIIYTALAGNIQIQPRSHFNFRLINCTPINPATLLQCRKYQIYQHQRHLTWYTDKTSPKPNLRQRGSSCDIAPITNLHVLQYQTDSFNLNLFKQMQLYHRVNGLTENWLWSLVLVQCNNQSLPWHLLPLYTSKQCLKNSQIRTWEHIYA